MSSLISGAAGSSWSRSSGLAAGSMIANSDVTAMDLQVCRNSLGPNAGRFRRSIADMTVDETGAPLGEAVVKLFRSANDVKVDEVESDLSGNYELSVYDDGPFYAVGYFSSSAPNRTGATVNSLTGV